MIGGRPATVPVVRPSLQVTGGGAAPGVLLAQLPPAGLRARRRAEDLGIATQLIVARAELDDLYDRLYVLEAAIEDVERDLAAADPPGERDYREALEWILEAARPLVSRRLGEGEAR